jgi:peptidoglycan DL-endopeptidase RipA
LRGARGTRGRIRENRGRDRNSNRNRLSTIHHVAIYIGNGMMVNAPFTGAFVRIDSMYAPGGLIGAVRPAG